MPAALRRLPPAVLIFFTISVIEICIALARSPTLWERHPGRGVAVVVLTALWLAAIVKWRQRWAWFLWLLVSLSVVVAPLWGEWPGAPIYAFNVLSAALLLTPSMRRYVVVKLPPAHDPTLR